MYNPTSTKENINAFIEFRQAVYTRIFQKRRDALFHALDALLDGGDFASFAYLSQSAHFQRQWPSLYAAVEDGQIDVVSLRQLLVKQLPQQGICVFPLDGSSWPRPRSRVLEDLQYVYQASSDADGGNVTVGYPYSLLEWCAEPHLEKDKPPAAVWFAWLPPLHPPAQIAITTQTIWTAYVNRWPIEPAMRFRKETLGWTLPRFQKAQTGDTWTHLVALAHWMLFLARPLVQDHPLLWQKAQTRLTPQRVRQSLETIFMQIGTPAQPPKLRGKSPGWPKGKRRTPKARHKVVKKGIPASQTT